MEEITDTGYWANIAAEELARALVLNGIGFMGVGGDDDGNVDIAFKSINDAEALMTLAVESNETLGGLYDRATSSCLTMASFGERDGDVSDAEIDFAIRQGWRWTIHPAMHGRRMGWHTSVTLSAGDANTITANLNALRNGGAL